MGDTTIRREPAGDAPTALRDDPLAVSQGRPLGLVGLGPDAIEVAQSLAAAGHRLLVWDPQEAHRDAYAGSGLDELGVELAVAADEVGRRCAIVLLLLALGGDRDLLHGALTETLAPGGLIIDMGPSLPGATRRMAAELAAKGLRLVDALLLPSDPPLILIGGSEADVALADPILSQLATCVTTGAVGSAQALSALIAELDEVPDLAKLRELIGRGGGISR